MDQLILCESCKHGAPLHGGDGCAVAKCACSSSRHAVIDRSIDLVRDDMFNQYRRDQGRET